MPFHLDTSLHPAKIPTLADFTSEALIIPQLQSRDMAGIIQELSEAFQRGDSRWDAQKLNKSALEREAQMTTAMEFGAAFPHVRSSACPELKFALGRCPEPVVWGRPGSLKVRFVFLNAVPASDALGYLKLLSGMARLGKDTDLLEQFKTAAGAHELLELLGKLPLRK
ncbi:MAG TPA: PTS sugar transporter subunit IIA [Verrucomicrobiae bacterium]|nr:PTS sugar transporter subunit IIA [Verrucomicrobiae bacterium]